jgi:NTE family protein
MKQHRKPSVKTRNHQPKIGLVLGSGSARGLAHIGVIHAIEEAGLTVDVIAGTSIGALVGAVYAAGRLDDLERDFRRFDWKAIGSMFDPVFPRSGLIDGKKAVEFIRAHLPYHTIDELSVPFCAIATDIATGEEVVISDGDLIEAVRASVSIPGIFTPARKDDRVLIDGGLVNPVPVSAARAMGAEIIIAVDLNHDMVAGMAVRRKARPAGIRENVLARLGVRNPVWEAYRVHNGLRTSDDPAAEPSRARSEKDQLPNMVEALMASIHIMQARITESRLQIERPDVLIRPPLSSVHLLEFDRAAEVITAGYDSARAPIRALARRLKGRSRSR